MLSLKQIIAQKNSIPKIKDLMAECESYEFDSSNWDAPVNNMLHQLRNFAFTKKMKKKIKYALLDIDYLKIVPHIQRRNQEELERGIKNVDICYFYGNNTEMIEQSFVSYLMENISDRKIIFLNLSLRHYCYDEDEVDRYATHGSCAFMVPRKGNGYDMYYINQHGEAMNSTLVYEKALTRTRNQKYTFSHPVDFIVMNEIVKYINCCLSEKIHYDFSTRHNFCGINYQEEDVHGFCFIFPMIIYYSLGMYFNCEKEVSCDSEIMNIPPISKTLKNGDLNFMIHSCFTEFDDYYNKVVFNHLKKCEEQEIFMKELDTVLAKLKFRFLKKITGYTLQYLTQPIMLKKINLPPKR